MAYTTTSQLRLSDISPLVIQSEIRSMSVECDRVGGINLAQGICDTEVPASVADAAVQAIRDGNNTYTRLDGISSLRQAIAVKLARHNGIVADPDSEVLVTAGATGAFYTACLALLNPGDEVILFEPFYGYHVNTLLSVRAQPVTVPLTAPTWDLDLDTLRSSITPRTRALVLNTPSNPSGKIFTLSELKAIADLAIEHDLFVFSDEIEHVSKQLGHWARTTFVGNNPPSARHEDFRLLTNCRDFIVANSSFSWWAAWLGKDSEKTVVAPAVWANDPEWDTDDIVPPDWIRA